MREREKKFAHEPFETILLNGNECDAYLKV